MIASFSSVVHVILTSDDSTESDCSFYIDQIYRFDDCLHHDQLYIYCMLFLTADDH